MTGGVVSGTVWYGPGSSIWWVSAALLGAAVIAVVGLWAYATRQARRDESRSTVRHPVKAAERPVASVVSPRDRSQPAAEEPVRAA